MGGDTGVPPDLPQDMVPQAMSDSLKQDLDQIVECLYLSVDNIDELVCIYPYACAYNMHGTYGIIESFSTKTDHNCKQKLFHSIII